MTWSHIALFDNVLLENICWARRNNIECVPCQFGQRLVSVSIVPYTR